MWMDGSSLVPFWDKPGGLHEFSLALQAASVQPCALAEAAAEGKEPSRASGKFWEGFKEQF